MLKLDPKIFILVILNQTQLKSTIKTKKKALYHIFFYRTIDKNRNGSEFITCHPSEVIEFQTTEFPSVQPQSNRRGRGQDKVFFL